MPTILIALAVGSSAMLSPLSHQPHLQRLGITTFKRAPPVDMGKRTREQRAAFSGARDTSDLNVLTTVRTVAKTRAAKVAVRICALSIAALLASRFRQSPVLRSALSCVITVALYAAKAACRLATSPALQSLGARVLTRLIDWGVPATILCFSVVFLGTAAGDDSAFAEKEEKGGSLLNKLLKGKPSKVGMAPAKEYIEIESLGEKLDSMAYTIQAATTSKADASSAQRRRHLSQRFGDELGTLSNTALAGIDAAEKTWRKKIGEVAKAEESARADLRSVSVEMGGLTAPGRTVGGERGSAPKKGRPRELEQKLRRAEKRLNEALEERLALESSFLQCASEALGSEAWEARAALAKLVRAPSSGSDLADVPLPRAAQPGVGKRAFVLDFQGDVGPAQVLAPTSSRLASLPSCPIDVTGPPPFPSADPYHATIPLPCHDPSTMCPSMHVLPAMCPSMHALGR